MRKNTQIVVAIQVLAILFFAAAGPAIAGDQDEESGKRANSLEEGAWSIQFGITDEVALRPFNSMGISVKRHMSPRSAFRIGANIGLDIDDRDSDQVTSLADTVSAGVFGEGDGNSLLVQLDLLYMRYANPDADVNFFLGTGPLVRFQRSDDDWKGTHTTPEGTSVEVRERYVRTWRIGAIGIGGVEWFATRSISFHAEYRLWLSYGRTKSESEANRPGDPDYHSESETSNGFWDFHGNKVTFGVSLYF